MQHSSPDLVLVNKNTYFTPKKHATKLREGQTTNDNIGSSFILNVDISFQKTVYTFKCYFPTVNIVGQIARMAPKFLKNQVSCIIHPSVHFAVEGQKINAALVNSLP